MAPCPSSRIGSRSDRSPAWAESACSESCFPAESGTATSPPDFETLPAYASARSRSPASSAPRASTSAAPHCAGVAPSAQVNSKHDGMRSSMQRSSSAASLPHCPSHAHTGVYSKTAAPPHAMPRLRLSAKFSTRHARSPTIARAVASACPSMAPPPTVPQIKPAADTSICEPTWRGADPALPTMVTSTPSQLAAATCNKLSAISRITASPPWSKYRPRRNFRHRLNFPAQKNSQHQSNPSC